MKLPDVLLLSASTGFFLIGLHQLYRISDTTNDYTQGLMGSYWLFMLSGLLLLWYKWRNPAQPRPNETPEKPLPNKPKNSNKKRTQRS